MAYALRRFSDVQYKRRMDHKEMDFALGSIDRSSGAFYRSAGFLTRHLSGADRNVRAPLFELFQKSFVVDRLDDTRVDHSGRVVFQNFRSGAAHFIHYRLHAFESRVSGVVSYFVTRRFGSSSLSSV